MLIMFLLCVVKLSGVDAMSEMSLGLRIRSKVNWVQNNATMGKQSFLCHPMTIHI